MTKAEQLRRQLILLGEAKSAIGQCCTPLGEARTNRILVELDGAQRDVTDRFNTELGR